MGLPSAKQTSSMKTKKGLGDKAKGTSKDKGASKEKKKGTHKKQSTMNGSKPGQVDNKNILNFEGGEVWDFKDPFGKLYKCNACFHFAKGNSGYSHGHKLFCTHSQNYGKTVAQAKESNISKKKDLVAKKNMRTQGLPKIGDTDSKAHKFFEPNTKKPKMAEQFAAPGSTKRSPRKNAHMKSPPSTAGTATKELFPGTGEADIIGGASKQQTQSARNGATISL